MLWHYKWKGKLYTSIELVFYFAFVKCDGEEGDKLCGKFTSRGKGVKNLCRFCTCPAERSDWVFVDYAQNAKPKTEPMIKKMIKNGDKEKLRSISQRYLHIAFHDIRMGIDAGIHQCCPMEMLHHILLGIFLYVVVCFRGHVGKSGKLHECIAALASRFGIDLSRQSDRDLPNCKFSKGIFTSKLMAHEYLGVLLVILCVLKSNLGKSHLKRRRKHFGKPADIPDWILLLETLLTWESFLKQTEIKKSHVTRLKNKNRYVMFLIKKVIKRTEGMMMRIPKFHQILHIWPGMDFFGAPANVNTGSNESHHKITKKAAKNTQRSIAKFEQQTATRLHEYWLLLMALAEMEGYLIHEYFDEDQKRGKPNYGTRIEAFDGTGGEKENKNGDLVDTRGTKIEFENDSDGDTHFAFTKDMAKDVDWNQDLVAYICYCQDEVKKQLKLSETTKFALDVRTEHVRKGQIFRGHPDYWSNGQWNDWALFDWGEHGHLPGEIWCFIKLDCVPDNFYLKLGDVHIRKGTYAVIENAAYITDGSVEKSELFQPIQKEVHIRNKDGSIYQRRFYLANVESIVDTCVVVPNYGPNILSYFVIEPRKNWPKLFTKWLDQPFDADLQDILTEETPTQPPKTPEKPPSRKRKGKKKKADGEDSDEEEEDMTKKEGTKKQKTTK